MIRKTLLCAAAAATAFVAFAATSLAVNGDAQPRLRANLPAASLPAVALAREDAIAVNNIVGPISDTAGITPESYSHLRLLSQTSVGPLYLIPGTHGTCLSLRYGAACGDPGGDARINAIAQLDRPMQRLVGGGVADDSVRSVAVIVVGLGIRETVPVERGAFSFAVSVPGFVPGKGVEFIAH